MLYRKTMSPTPSGEEPLLLLSLDENHMQPCTAKSELGHICLVAYWGNFPFSIWGLETGGAGWMRRNLSTLCSLQPDAILGTWPASSVVIRLHKGSTVEGQLPYYPTVYRNQRLSPTCDGQGLGGSAGGSGNNPDLVAENKNTNY